MPKEYVLHKKQEAFLELIQHESRCGYLGGIRSGKTIAGSHAALMLIIERPHEIGAIFSPTFPQLSQMTLKEFKSVLESYEIFQDVHYVVDVHPKDKFGYESKWPKNHKGIWSFWNGAQVYTFSLESFYRGAEFGWAWGDEIQEASDEDLTTVLGRMSGSPDPKTFYTYTPPRNNPDIDRLTYAANEEHAGGGDLPLVVGTTYDNARNLTASYLEGLELGMDPVTLAREVYCRKVATVGFPWLYAFKNTVHVSEEAQYQPYQLVYVSFDFNNNPYVCVLSHRFRDENNKLHLHYFDAIELNPTMVTEGTFIEVMCKEIKKRTPMQANNNLYLITGDRNGRNQQLTMRVGENVWTDIRKCMNVSDGQFRLFNSNPTHADSRNLCNAIFSNSEKPNGVQVRINPKCTGLIFDCQYVQAKNGDEKEKDSLLKDKRSDRTQQADFMDAMRYDIHAFNNDYFIYHG